MIYDCHVHMHTDPNGDTRYDSLPGLLKEAGVDGMILIGDRPNSFSPIYGPTTNRQRMDNLVKTAEMGGNLYPFYWIDPIEPDALEQVDEAVSRGVAGFKAICGQYMPDDPRAMQVWCHIAKKNKPLLFHSGILYDRMASGRYNKPIGFEPLLFIPGLRFALAHISWPWCDELVSLLGKWSCTMQDNPERFAQLFIDTTPGTPQLYRKDALQKLLTIYDYRDNVMFGTDCLAERYRPEYAQRWLTFDRRVFQELDLPQSTVDSVLGGAMQRFLLG